MLHSPRVFGAAPSIAHSTSFPDMLERELMEVGMVEISIQTRSLALKLLAASRDAVHEHYFNPGSRSRKAAIANQAALAMEETGDTALAQDLHTLARKLVATDCWGARPRVGLSKTFSQAAFLLYPGVDMELNTMVAATAGWSAETMRQVWGEIVSGQDDLGGPVCIRD